MGATMKAPMTPEEHTTSRTEFWAKNKALGRPTSPHLTIYKFQLTSMLSITHRGTGLIQSGYLTAVGGGAIWPQYLTLYCSIWSRNFTLAPPSYFLPSSCSLGL